MAEQERTSEEVLDEFIRTGKIPTGYTFDGRSLSRTIADKQERAAADADGETPDGEQSATKTTKKKGGKE